MERGGGYVVVTEEKENRNEEDNLVNVSAEGRIIIKRILREQEWRTSSGFIWFRIEINVGLS